MGARIEISPGSIDPFPPGPESATTEPQPPMVYVSDAPRWEYKIVNRASDGALPDEAELNGWGDDEWELAGIVTLAGRARFFFKRPARRP